ncbi:hypothetical protein [Streptomyces mirabilis]|uniref:hypothetical protein n=1 Tax=Streptomyces mirabilis TaxID=68239 RepID=UPI0036556D20
MSQLRRLTELYTVAEDVAEGRSSLELVSIADQTAWHIDQILRSLTAALSDGSATPLAAVVACARSLRWRLLTEPFPIRHGVARSARAYELEQMATRCMTSVDDVLHTPLRELILLTQAIHTDTVPPTGELLLQSITEIGAADCVVILASPRAAEGTQDWFDEENLRAHVASDSQHSQLAVHDTAYYIGPPSLFGASATASPRARNITYMFGSWVRDRRIPRLRLAVYAEGTPALRIRTFQVGDQPDLRSQPPSVVMDLRPEPVWSPPPTNRVVRPDDVMARQILLGGGLSIMLDTNGELIRTLNPARPVGERVELRRVADLVTGAYLVLREGETGRGALYERTMQLLGDNSAAIETTQSEWKSALQQRLSSLGRADVVDALRRAGLKAASQAPAWTERTVARPQRDEDFLLLLRWLELEPDRYLGNAALLRRRRSQAMADVREELEQALADADTQHLEHDGCLRIDPAGTGFAGITAARVLAIAPYEVPVHKHAVRIPRDDRSARWLE